MNGLEGWKVWYYVDCGHSVGGFPCDENHLREFLKDKVPYTDQRDKLAELELNAAVAAAYVR